MIQAISCNLNITCCYGYEVKFSTYNKRPSFSSIWNRNTRIL